MQEATKRVRLMRVIDPSFCGECRFAGLAKVSFPGGVSKTMFHCSRLDCDNWDSLTEASSEDAPAQEFS